MAHVIVPDAEPREVFVVGGSSVSAFYVSFTFFNTARMFATVDGVPVAIDSVIGNGDTRAGFQGGTVILVQSVTNATVVIYEDRLLERLSDFENTGPFPIAALNDDLDYQVGMMQTLRSRMDRSLRLPYGDARSGAGFELPPASEQSDVYLKLDSMGNLDFASVPELPLTATAIGELLYPGPTLLESGLTVQDQSYPVGNLLRYIDSGEHSAIIGRSSTVDVSGIIEAVSAVMPVYVPSGTYRVSTSITLANPVCYADGAVFERFSGAVISLSGPHPEYSVFSAGAVGDGVADDTAALQAALDTAGAIYFGDDNSVFKITSRLEGVSHTKIRGRGKITSVEEIDLLIFVSATIEEIPDTVNFEVDGLTFEHTTPGGTDTSFFAGHGFLTWRSKDVVIKNCKFVNINSRPVDLKLTINTILKNCYSNGNGFTWSGDVNAVGGEVYSINTCQGTRVLNCSAIGGGSNSISAFRSDDVIISNNFVSESKRSGINQTGNAIVAATNAVSSLIVASDVASVITTDDNDFLDGSYVQIKGITGGAAAINRDRPYRITRTGTNSFTFATSGIADQPATGTITARLTGGQNCIYSDNVIEDSWGGILVENEAHGAVVSNNTMRNMRNNFGVQIAGGHGDAPTSAVVTGNSMIDCEGGIVVLGAPGCVVSSNTVERARVVGLRLDNASSGAQNTGCSIHGNVISDCDLLGIEINASSDCSISSNVVRNVGTVGIQLNEDSDRNLIHGNVIHEPSSNGGSAGIQISNGCESNEVDNNKITAGAHAMPFGINLLTGSASNTGVNNTVIGASTVAINYQSAAGENLFTGSAPKTYESVMTGSETFNAFKADVFLLFPDGDPRTLTPTGNFGQGQRFTIVNRGAQDITIGGTSIVVSGNTASDIIYSNGAWVEIGAS